MSSNINQDGGGEWVSVENKRNVNNKKVSSVAQGKDQVIILLVGLPGSGKSFFASKLESESCSHYVRVNQDSLGTRKKCENACRQALSRGKSVIIDRCNFDATQRGHWLQIGKECGVPCECVVFSYDKELCISRCKDRTDHQTIDKWNAASVVRGMNKNYRPPLQHSPQYKRHFTINSFRKSNEIVQSYLDRFAE